MCEGNVCVTGATVASDDLRPPRRDALGRRWVSGGPPPPVCPRPPGQRGFSLNLALTTGGGGHTLHDGALQRIGLIKTSRASNGEQLPLIKSILLTERESESWHGYLIGFDYSYEFSYRITQKKQTQKKKDSKWLGVEKARPRHELISPFLVALSLRTQCRCLNGEKKIK